MILQVEFQESIQSFDVDFGEVHTISDGGFDRGYAEGYEQGVKSVPDYLAALLTNSISEYANDKITQIRASAFISCTSLVSINVPKVTALGASCFQGCTNLKLVNAPSVKTINSKSFSQCSVIERLEFPQLTTFNQGDNFTYCSNLKYVDLGNVGQLNSWVFASCSKLTTVILRRNSVAKLATTNAFSSSAIEKGTGYIYVPDNLVEQYKAAANWSTFAAQIRPISELPQ